MEAGSRMDRAVQRVRSFLYVCRLYLKAEIEYQFATKNTGRHSLSRISVRNQPGN